MTTTPDAVLLFPYRAALLGALMVVLAVVPVVVRGSLPLYPLRCLLTAYAHGAVLALALTPLRLPAAPPTWWGVAGILAGLAVDRLLHQPSVVGVFPGPAPSYGTLESPPAALLPPPITEALGRALAVDGLGLIALLVTASSVPPGATVALAHIALAAGDHVTTIPIAAVAALLAAAVSLRASPCPAAVVAAAGGVLLYRTVPGLSHREVYVGGMGVVKFTAVVLGAVVVQSSI